MMAVPLLGALLLAGCGGDNSTPAMHGQQAGQGVAVGEPNGGVPAVSEFIKAAQEEACADQKNRLYLIDGKYVFWDRAGNCADNAYSQRLFGAQPQTVLCQAGDSIAGPRTFCTDDKPRPMFETIQANLDKPDLGLGAGHKVEPIAFLPNQGAAIPFESLAKGAFSGVSMPRQVVIKDAAAWEALWLEHGGPDAKPPAVDFHGKMVIGVFMGRQGNGCYSTAISNISRDSNKINVLYLDEVPGKDVLCTLAVTAPAHLVEIDRSDMPVEFAREVRTVE